MSCVPKECPKVAKLSLWVRTVLTSFICHKMQWGSCLLFWGCFLNLHSENLHFSPLSFRERSSTSQGGPCNSIFVSYAENFPCLRFQNVSWKQCTLCRERQRREMFIIPPHICKSRKKSSGEMNTVKITVLTRNIFRYFMLFFSCRGRELLLFPCFEP